MKKNRNQTGKQKQKQRKQARVTVAAPERRSFLKAVPYLAGGAVVLAGVGYFGVSTVRADLAEQDLSIIGSGEPVIVQIHDPGCAICTALQKETRAALDMMDDDALPYRVASLTSTTGATFANRHSAGYATLLFFDGRGQVTQRVQGATNRDTLLTAFTAHNAAYR